MTSNLKNLIEKYWVVYYIVYVVGVVVIVALQWQKLQADVDPIFRLAAIFGVSAGIASFLAIVSEVFGRMVLLIPSAVKRLKDAGRKEGLEEGRVEGRAKGRVEGRVEGREEERIRVQKILNRLDDGLPSEVIERLKSELLDSDLEK